MIAGIFETYEDYLRSDIWKEKCEAAKAGACAVCGCSGQLKVLDEETGNIDIYYRPLQVHHVSYATVGNEGVADLRTLCVVCHNEEHGIKLEPFLMREYNKKRKDICGWWRKYKIRLWKYA